MSTPGDLPQESYPSHGGSPQRAADQEVAPLAYLWRLLSGAGAIVALGGGGILVWNYLSAYLATLRSNQPKEALFFGLLVSGLIVLGGLAQAAFAFKAKHNASIRGLLLTPACLYLDYLALSGWTWLFSAQ